jgi:peptidyl-prolyl cis-trans isomerase SurA
LRNSENIGWLWSFELNIKILDKIKNLKIGEFSEPIILEDGWHIYELRDKKTDFNISNKEFEYVKNQIINRKLEMATKNFLNDLKKRASIRFE